MSKELEALENIKQARYFVDFELDAKVSEDYKKELDIIETALKEKENIEKTINELFSENGKVITTIDIKKKLKALEIIKEKMVDLEDLNDAIYEDNYHQNNEHNAIDIYNQNRFEYKHLTQEEIDLLKEVLL